MYSNRTKITLGEKIFRKLYVKKLYVKLATKKQRLRKTFDYKKLR